MTWLLLLLAVGVPALPERDDPTGRARAMELLNGPRTPEAQLGILRAAETEAVKYGLRPGAPQRSTAVPGRAWISLGPTAASYDVNVSYQYAKVDSGRVRDILVDPRDPNVVYLATSGGGVWKTFDALAPVTSSSGPHWQPITDTIGSLSVGTLAMNPRAPDALLLGLGDPFEARTPGFLHSDDGGATWSAPVVLSGSYASGGGVYTASSVRDIKFNAAGTTVFAATDVGLFRSTVAGTGDASTWKLLSMDALNRSLESCWSIAYVGGQTWLVASVEDLASPPAGHLFRTTDDGVSWTDVTAALGTADVKRMTVATSAADQNDPAHARAYLIAEWVPDNHASSEDQKDAFRSDDGGASWVSLFMAKGQKTPTDPVPGDQPDLDLMHLQAWYNQMLVVDPANHDNVFAAGDLCMARSLDGGGSWSILTDWLPFAVYPNAWPDATYAHADWHAGTIARANGQAWFYGGTDGGLFRSTNDFLTAPDNGAVWEDRLNRGVVSHLAWSVVTGSERAGTAQCPAPAGTSAIIFAGLQDNGTRLRDPNSSTIFNQVTGGDGFGVGLGCDGTGGAVGSALLATYTSKISVSNNGGQSFATTVDGTGKGLTPQISLDPYYNFIMRLAAVLPDPAGRTYLTPLTDSSLKGYVYRSTNGGQSWTSLITTYAPAAGGTAAGPLGSPMKNVAADPLHAGHYGALTTRRAYTYSDTDGLWMETAPLDAQPNGAVLEPQTIALDPTNLNVIWVGSKATQRSDGSAPTAHLFRCTSARSTQRCTAGWTAIGGGLPGNVPVNVVKLDPGDAKTVYVGTEIGLYRSTDGGASFALYGTGLPLVDVTDIAVALDGSNVRIATFGRGFWEIQNDVAAPGGVHGNGDLDRNQQIDGFDVVRESALLFTNSTMNDYDWVGDLVSANNSIGPADLSALLDKLGGRP